MKWIITHESALEFWRKVSAAEIPLSKRIIDSKLPDSVEDIVVLLASLPVELDKPLHVLIGKNSGRHSTKGLVQHVCTARLPSRSFIQIAPGLAVSSPELCFAQMANGYGQVELIKLGYEFCGVYRLDEDQEYQIDKEGKPARGFRDDVALTSVAKLAAYAAKLNNVKGLAKAKRASRCIIDASASPMETILAMILTLPQLLGGFGLPKPTLNHRIELSAKAKQVLRRQYFVCDLCWLPIRLVLEYDSDAYHTETEKIALDAIRRNALEYVGLDVITVSREQVVNIVELRKIVELISKKLGRQLRLKPDFMARHADLRSQLLPSSKNR